MINRLDDVARFAKIVGFSIARKSEKLGDALAIVRRCRWNARSPAWRQVYVKIHGEWVKPTNPDPNLVKGIKPAF